VTLQARLSKLSTASTSPSAKVDDMAATDVLAQILRLPADERARLALELIRSLDGEREAGAAEAWDAELLAPLDEPSDPSTRGRRDR
jgi:hypothetical protein